MSSVSTKVIDGFLACTATMTTATAMAQDTSVINYVNQGEFNDPLVSQVIIPIITGLIVPFIKELIMEWREKHRIKQQNKLNNKM